MKARGAALAIAAVGIAIAAGLSLPSSRESRNLVSDKSLICMVNDRVMRQPQIPVPVGDKTYYGCCAGCVGRLKNDRRVRVAIDPVSGREVDKADAVILRDVGGGALYFETAETAKLYTPAAAPDGGS